ncbi:MAG: hypothetical protein E6868_08530 [Pantoea sp.]|uniref:glycine-rich domain-containing protein n=1 Tax=Pantoea sp. TaxID=69393 RepID=UPI00290283B6|nr:hypothetical protein [Pantoea sp.]MDU1573283.1 hypothetical protein [Pantoea sp.]
MAINNFKPFATGSGANVLSQADYESLAALSSGFQAGKASSAQINKALRQGAVMASILAQFIADSSGNDVLDNGNTASILASLKSGLLASSPGRLIGLRVFTASGAYTPTAGTKSIEVEVQGAGGGGGGATATNSSQLSVGCGGSAGAYAKSRITNLQSSYAVVVGTGGAGGNPGNGSAGGASTFDTITAGGGFGGGASGAATPPSLQNTLGNSTATGGNILNIGGGAAVVAMGLSLATAISGGGGTSQFGTGGGTHGSAGGGLAPTGYGAGGGGSVAYANNSTIYSGSAGGNGIVIIREYA